MPGIHFHYFVDNIQGASVEGLQAAGPIHKGPHDGRGRLQPRQYDELQVFRELAKSRRGGRAFTRTHEHMPHQGHLYGTCHSSRCRICRKDEVL